MSNKSPNPKLFLVASAFAAFLSTFNETFLNVAFTPIMADLAVDVNTVQWLATAYMLGAAVMVPISAFAYRSIPTRPLFVACSSLLVIGSVVGGLAQDFTVLLIGRIIQALGTGLLVPISMNITLEVAPRQKLGSYMGIMGAMTTLGPSSSIILAGLVLAVADWHAMMWLFGALSLICLLYGAFLLRDIAQLTKPRLDTVSVIAVSIAFIGILYGISTSFSGPLPVAAGSALVGLVFLVLFVRRQKTLEQPLIDLRPLGVLPFALGVAANMLALITVFAMNILIPTFLQSAMGTSSLGAAVTLFPAILCSCILAPIAGRIFDKRGAGLLLPAGFVLMGVFSMLTALFAPNAAGVLLTALYIPVICGSALVIGPAQSFALSKLPHDLNAHGVTVMSTGFQVSGCIGSSVFMGIYSLGIGTSLANGQDASAAFSNGFLAAGIAVAAVCVLGLACGLATRRFEKKKLGVADTVATAAANSAADANSASAPAAGAAPVYTAAAHDLMQRDVYTLQSTDTVAQALRLFVEKGISGAPVVDGGQVVGFLSDGDVMRTLADQSPAFKNAWSFVVEQGNRDFDRTVSVVLERPVMELATKRVLCIQADDSLGAACRILADNHLKKAPVTRGDQMIGIINRSNISRYAVNEYLTQ